MMHYHFYSFWCSDYSRFSQQGFLANTLTSVFFWNCPISLWTLPCCLTQLDGVAFFVCSLSMIWNQTFFWGTLVILIDDWYLKTKIWVWDLLIATWGSLLPSPFSGKGYIYKEIWAHVNRWDWNLTLHTFFE